MISRMQGRTNEAKRMRTGVAATLMRAEVAAGIRRLGKRCAPGTPDDKGDARLSPVRPLRARGEAAHAAVDDATVAMGPCSSSGRVG